MSALLGVRIIEVLLWSEMGDASVGGVWSTYFKSKKQSEEHTPLSRTEILLAGKTSVLWTMFLSWILSSKQ